MVVLVLMLQPSVAAAFAEAAAGRAGGGPMPDEPPDYHDRFQQGGEPTPPDDRFKG